MALGAAEQASATIAHGIAGVDELVRTLYLDPVPPKNEILAEFKIARARLVSLQIKVRALSLPSLPRCMFPASWLRTYVGSNANSYAARHASRHHRVLSGPCSLMAVVARCARGRSSPASCPTLHRR